MTDKELELFKLLCLKYCELNRCNEGGWGRGRCIKHAIDSLSFEVSSKEFQEAYEFCKGF